MITVQVELELWQEILYLTQLCAPNEVTAIGEIVIISPTLLEVRDHYLPRQRVGVATAEWAKTAQAEIITEIIQNGGDVADLKLRWHSHGSGVPFISGIDEMDILMYDGDWVVNLVVNDKGDYHIQLDQLRPLLIRNIPVRLQIIYPELDQEHLDELAKLKEEKVSVQSKWLKGRKMRV